MLNPPANQPATRLSQPIRPKIAIMSIGPPPAVINPPPPAYQSPAHAETQAPKPDTQPQINELPPPPYFGSSPEFAYSPAPDNPRGTMESSGNLSADRDTELGPYLTPHGRLDTGITIPTCRLTGLLILIFVVVAGIGFAVYSRPQSSS